MWPQARVYGGDVGARMLHDMPAHAAAFREAQEGAEVSPSKMVLIGDIQTTQLGELPVRA